MEVIKKIDRRPGQMLLDARVVAIKRADLLSLGLKWSWPAVVRAGDESATGVRPYGVQFGYTPDRTFTDSLMMALNLLQENDQAHTIANPKVVAWDGLQAQMRVVQNEWFMMTGSQTAGNSDARPELQRVESGVVLKITPYVGDNNDITLQMAVEASDSVPKARGSDQPLVTRRMVAKSVTVKDGGTVAISGLTENPGRSDMQQASVLSALPLLGGLFKSRGTDKPGREVAVFVTVHLLPEPGAPPASTTPPASPAPQTLPTDKALDATPIRMRDSAAEHSNANSASPRLLDRRSEVQKPNASVRNAEKEKATTGASLSQAWYVMRQWNCPPLLLGLPQQFAKVLEPSQQRGPPWQQVGDGGTLRLKLDVEGDLPGVQERRFETAESLPADRLFQDKSKAGIVRIRRPGSGTPTATEA